jgi:hypothetical protein
VVRYRQEGFSAGLTAPLTACRGRRSDLAAPPAIAEPPAKQKHNNQDDDDESRC